MTAEPIRSILIAGGGTAGWMAAAALAGRLQKLNVSIKVVESPDIPTIGVGEATVPGIRDFFRDLGVADTEVMRETQGTAKLGIEFEGWSRPGESFFHPFGLYGIRSRGVAFHHYWLKLRAAGDVHPLDDYSLCTAMARAGRFALPPDQTVPDFAFFNYAVHFDAGLYARFLARYAVERGVEHVPGTIVDVRRGAGERIESVQLKNGPWVEADMFIDCTGFRSLLLGKSLGVDYIDWSHFLPCDRAVAMPCAHGAEGFTPYTRSTAWRAGWRWRIPLQNRVGNGFVYSSSHISDDEAAGMLAGDLEGDPTGTPNFIRFTTGRRQRFWAGNCIALGLAAGFLEPLESTSITLIQTAVERLVELFPSRAFDPVLADEFNRTTALEYDRIRDFLLLHYVGNQRVGEPMWDACRAIELPPELDRKVQLFTRRGKLVRYEWETFQDPSWLSIYAGLGMLPQAWDPLANHFSTEELAASLSRMREQIARIVASARPHEEFIRSECSSLA